ncbi:MAG: heme lyase CcmF/NrfE family subunit, partial [Candidatus Dadabacteria bacterium]
LLVSFSLFMLVWLFLTDSYYVAYVWQYSEKRMSIFYKVAAVWGGMDGSMLLWCFFLALAFLVLLKNLSYYPKALVPWLLVVLNTAQLFFLTVLVFVANPFTYLENAPYIPSDGNGLNPLLQNVYMAFHPPVIYAGFTFLTVPFAFAASALFAADKEGKWYIYVRNWSRISWLFLTAGITLGSFWAYIELGWGGFWAWDPVENSSFLPWLVLTALIHSGRAQEVRGILRGWNLWLAFLGYLLSIFGTFLTRSGIVQSVHAFASTDVGWVFLVYMGFITFIFTFFYLRNRQAVGSSSRIESFFSMEMAFLINNLLLLSICFATLWGVLFPVFSDDLTGKKQAVGAPYFNTINSPLFLVLLLMIGIGPFYSWKETNLSHLFSFLRLPFLFTFLFFLTLLFLGFSSNLWALCFFSASFLIVFGIVLDFIRGYLKHFKSGGGVFTSFFNLFKFHSRRYASHIVHLGVAISAVAITASTVFKYEKEIVLKHGESLNVGSYVFTLKETTQRSGRNYTALRASLTVKREGSGKVFTLKPELRHYPRNNERTSEVAIYSTLLEDVYLVLVGIEPQDNGEDLTVFKVYFNPLQVWLWIGVCVILIGGIIILKFSD